MVYKQWYTLYNGPFVQRFPNISCSCDHFAFCCIFFLVLVQVYGGMGVCQDTPLPAMYAGARSLRIADGPDVVHMETVAKEELKQQLQQAKL